MCSVVHAISYCYLTPPPKVVLVDRMQALRARAENCAASSTRPEEHCRAGSLPAAQINLARIAS